MASKKTLLGAAAFSAALAAGGVAGALLGTPSTSGAQDGTTSSTTATANGTERPIHPMRHPRAEVLKVAADTLGMTPADLLKELRAGKSIADVAQEKGVPEQTVVDAIVADAKAKLEAEIQKLPDQVTRAVEHDGVPARPDGARGPRGDHQDEPAAQSSSS